jgi:hypothetical protein
MSTATEKWAAMTARERDAAVAQSVMGWVAFPYSMPDGKGGWETRLCPPSNVHITTCDTFPRYTTDPSADYEVLKRVRESKWIDDREEAYNMFWNSLAEILRSRDPYYRDTENQNELYYMLEYRPGDFSHAAFLALEGA